MPRMKCFLFCMALFSAAVGFQSSASALDVSTDAGEYHFCHRCGMAVAKSDKVITVGGVLEAPWYQCCPMCALMDIIETGKGSGFVTAYDHQTGHKVEITVTNGRLSQVEPQSTLLLVGGSCPKNKIFQNKAAARAFIRANHWAKEEMLKSPAKVFAKLKDKKRALNLCKMCTAQLKGHEKTWFTIMTSDQKRMVMCCGHCGLFSMYKLRDRAKRATTVDFISGKLIDAKNAFYVADNDMLLCCFPSTISFADKQDAKAFQKEHGGKILTFEEAMANINIIMKK